MTDNIRRMYELAQTEKVVTGYAFDFSIYPSDVIGYEPRRDYPPFTAQKQLELIKFISMKESGFGMLYIDNVGHGLYRVSFRQHKEMTSKSFDTQCINIDFEQALAGLICNIWGTLTYEQQKELKRILE